MVQFYSALVAQFSAALDIMGKLHMNLADYLVRLIGISHPTPGYQSGTQSPIAARIP